MKERVGGKKTTKTKNEPFLKWNEKWYFFMSLFLTVRYDGHFLSEIRLKRKTKNKTFFAVAQEMDNGHSCHDSINN